MHHHVNHGGTEFVVYRATPADVTSGVRVGDREYPGFPASGAGIPNADPALHVAFFALAWDQDLNAPIKVFARDVAGNEATADFEFRVFPKPFRSSKIDLPDAFLQRVVPAILSSTPSLKVDDPGDLLASFLVINRDLRRENTAAIKQMATKTGPKMLWTSAVHATGQLAGGSELRRQADLLLQGSRKSIARCTSASTSPSRRTCRCSPPTPASSSSPAGSASTATASSSITAWACSRCTRTCPRSTSRRATA